MSIPLAPAGAAAAYRAADALPSAATGAPAVPASARR